MTLARRRILVSLTAALLSLPVVALTGSAWHVQGFTDATGWQVDDGDGHHFWSVDQDTLQAVRAQLPAHLAARSDARVAPGLRDFLVRVHGEVRNDGRKVVFVNGECSDALRERLRSSARARAAVDSTPPPEAITSGPDGYQPCEFSAIHDPEVGRLIFFSSEGLGADATDKRTDCAGEAFTAAMSLRELPVDIRRNLQARSALGDRGDRFSPGCTSPEIERNHFMLAAVGARRAWALVESGGNAIGFTTWTFSKRGDHWGGESAREWSGFDRIPTSLQGLVSHVCLGAPPPPLRLPLENVDDRLRGDPADDGSPRLTIAIDGYAAYVLRHHASSPSTAAGDEIQAAHEGDRVITPEERVALRERLRLIRQASKPTSQAYATVGTFLKALERDHPAGDRIATMERRRP